MSFPAYPDYKHSGIELLPEYPSHWALKRFKNVFEERAERSSDGSEELLSVSAYFGVKPRSETLDEGDHLSRAESLEGYKVCRAGDLVINIMLAWNRGLGFSWQHGIVSPAYSVFHVTDGSYPKFLDYLVRSDEYIRYFKTHSAGIMDSRLRLYPESFGRLFSAIPPACEQTQIARFLDHETARIDALIEEQQRLIELLKEKRQAVISHAVTKGLDPTVPMKNSGVEWLGEVPAHWAVNTVRRCLVEHRQGYYSSAPYVDEGVKLLRITDLKDLGHIDTLDCPQVEDVAELDNFLLKNGDVVFARTGGAGSFGIVSELEEKLAYASYLIRFRFDLKRLNPQFLRYIFIADNFQMSVRANIHGGVNQNIHAEDIKDVFVCLPPLEEQREISLFLSSQCDLYNRLIDETFLAVDLMQERRSALISAAVTGKIDVRDWRPPVSTQTPESAVAEAN